MKIKRIAFEKLCNSVGSCIEIQGVPTWCYNLDQWSHLQLKREDVYTKNFIWIWIPLNQCTCYFQEHQFAGVKRIILAALHFRWKWLFLFLPYKHKPCSNQHFSFIEKTSYNKLEPRWKIVFGLIGKKVLPNGFSLNSGPTKYKLDKPVFCRNMSY